jgi:hypothetical protein
MVRSTNIRQMDNQFNFSKNNLGPLGGVSTSAVERERERAREWTWMKKHEVSFISFA